MSDAYAHDQKATLVSGDADYYDRALDVAIAVAALNFLLGLATLVGALGLETTGPALTDLMAGVAVAGVGGVGLVAAFTALNVVAIPSQRVRGLGVGLVAGLALLTTLSTVPSVDLGALLGAVLVLDGLAVGLAGIISRIGVVDTEPNASAGALAGLLFGGVGFVLGVALNGLVLDGVPVVLTGLLVAAALVLLTVLPREDLGSTLPAALIVSLLGIIVVGSVVDAGWTWTPTEPMNGGLTGGVVVSLFVVLGSLLAGWAAAKARARYGARGRQYGSFLVIYLNATLTVIVMISIVTFVAIRGLHYTFHGFTIGALSGLVVLSPVLVAALAYARRPAGAPDWNSGVRQIVRVLPLATVGAVAALLVAVVIRGEPFVHRFTYRIMESRQEQALETAFTVTPELTVGTLIVAIPGSVLFAYFYRKYGSLTGVGRSFDRQSAVQRGLGLAVAAVLTLAVVFLLGGPQPFGLPLGKTIGFGGVVVASVAAAVLAVVAVGGLLAGDGTLAERARRNAQFVKVGLFGGLGVVLAATLLQPTTTTTPSVGGVDLLPAAAAVGAMAGLVVAAVATLARRATGTDDAEQRLMGRLLAEEIRLGLVAATGFVVLIVGHVATTDSPFSVAGLTVSDGGTLSWPMVMFSAIPLGAEPGGILPAVVGTVWIVVGASLFAIPLGVGAAVFLTEYAEQGRFTALVEITTNALWSTPSVVFGLFGAAFLIPRLGDTPSLMAAMITLGFMLLPLVLITSREAIKSVPDEYRNASAALGVNRWETIRSVVLPAAVPGVVTGVILGVGRIAGETAPLILVLGVGDAGQSVDVLGGFQFITEPPFVYNGALLEASKALPKQVWAVIAAGVSGSPSKGWGTALLLLAVVLSFYLVGILTRRYFRRKLDYE
ncbi:phosphate ABC transporter permease PstA [Halorhabdus amylolytica]|uniref:phosphate ABC transporter permease PstA n=1 Tax=Halorhabdus amylolytica TaxID=2559573 RepID=UPI0010A9D07A|nr:phosphate ABC transporter permease PstA [Halorhabdus amylolytica]